VVLCQPSHPGNIGAAARALKTMGLKRLVLVAPAAFPHPDADARASGALDVLTSASCVATIDEALVGVSFALALSARRRDLTPQIVDVRTAAREIIEQARHEEVAVLFGTERTGLGIDEVSRCHRLVRIPANPVYASLNLAASVQVVAYELRCALEADVVTKADPSGHTPAPFEDVERLIEHLDQAMRAIGFLEPTRPGRLIQRMRRMFARARPEAEEIAILRGFLNAITDFRRR
jgi:tRNA/rRNA methyltransferase